MDPPENVKVYVIFFVGGYQMLTKSGLAVLVWRLGVRYSGKYGSLETKCKRTLHIAFCLEFDKSTVKRFENH